MLSVPSKESRAPIMAMPMAGWVMALSARRLSSSAKASAASAGRSMVPSAATIPGPKRSIRGWIGRPTRGHHVAGDLVGVDELGAAGHQ